MAGIPVPWPVCTPSTALPLRKGIFLPHMTYTWTTSGSAEWPQGVGSVMLWRETWRSGPSAWPCTSSKTRLPSGRQRGGSEFLSPPSISLYTKRTVLIVPSLEQSKLVNKIFRLKYIKIQTFSRKVLDKAERTSYSNNRKVSHSSDCWIRGVSFGPPWGSRVYNII